MCRIVIRGKLRARREGEYEHRHTILDWVARAGFTAKVILSKNQKEVKE